LIRISPCVTGWRGVASSGVREFELGVNTGDRTYALGTGYGHVALAVDDLGETLARLKQR
jgi:hypothetical protein